MIEEWKYIDNTNNLYMVSNLGKVKSMPRKIKTPYGSYMTKENILKGSKNQKGYIQIEYNINKKRYVQQLHRIVAKVFIPNPLDKPQINHKDGNKENNKVNNLEWVTNKENMQHAYQTGLQYNAFGKEARNFKYSYSSNENDNIKNMTALEIAKYINKNIKKCNVVSTASNIRQREKAFKMTFRKEVVQ